MKATAILPLLMLSHLVGQNTITLSLYDIGFNYPITSSILDVEASYFFNSRITDVKGQEISIGLYDAPFKKSWDFYFPFYYVGTPDFSEIRLNSIYIVSSLPYGLSIGFIRNEKEEDLLHLTSFEFVTPPMTKTIVNKYLIGYSISSGRNKISLGADVQDFSLNLFDLAEGSVWTTSISSHYERSNLNKIDKIALGFNVTDIIEYSSSSYYKGFKTINGFYNQTLLNGFMKIGLVKRVVKLDSTGSVYNSNVFENQNIDLEVFANKTASFKMRVISDGMYLLGTNINWEIKKFNKKMHRIRFKFLFGNNKFSISEWYGNGSYFSFHTNFAMDLFSK